MRAIDVIEGKVSVLDRADVDTDQIIPKQFLKRIERTGFGEFLFYDWIRDGEIELEPNPVLVAGANFGSGSSREHAVWALADFGFEAVIAPSFSDIFYSNATKNGLLPVVVDEATSEWLLQHPGVEIEIDLEAREVRLPDGTRAPFPIEAFARRCLMHGLDELGHLLAHETAIAQYERAHAPRTQTTSL